MAIRTLSKLTVKAIQKLIRDAKRTGKVQASADGGGLTFTVSKTGHPVWVLRDRHGGKSREYTLTTAATAEDYGLTAARNERDTLRQRVRSGEDIALTKKLGDPTKLSTFESLADEWYSRRIEPNLQNSQIIRRVLEKDILPKVGAISLKDLEPHHIDDVLREIVKRGAPTIANDALRYITFSNH